MGHSTVKITIPMKEIGMINSNFMTMKLPMIYFTHTDSKENPTNFQVRTEILRAQSSPQDRVFAVLALILDETAEPNNQEHHGRGRRRHTAQHNTAADGEPDQQQQPCQCHQNTTHMLHNRQSRQPMVLGKVSIHTENMNLGSILCHCTMNHRPSRMIWNSETCRATESRIRHMWLLGICP